LSLFAGGSISTSSLAISVGLSAAIDEAGRISFSGGFLVQALPRADETEIEAVMANIAVLPPLADVLKDGPDALLGRIFGDTPYTRLESHDLFFRCGCSREKVERALTSFSNADIKEMIADDGGAQVVCEFCRQSYSFSGEELEQVAGQPAAPDGR
jgi:molecular chaperone Hsp33